VSSGLPAEWRLRGCYADEAYVGYRPGVSLCCHSLNVVIKYRWCIPLELRGEYSYAQLLAMCHLVVELRRHVNEKTCLYPLPQIDRLRHDVCLWPTDIAVDALHVTSRSRGAPAGCVVWLYGLQRGRMFPCKDNGRWCSSTARSKVPGASTFQG
jgi:hypothetical protein